MTDDLSEYLNARYDEEGKSYSLGSTRSDLATKRAIVAWCGAREKVYIGTLLHSDPTDPNNYVEGQYANQTDSVVLRILVQQYASRSDFNPEWRM